jgi:pyruvate kinase
MERIPPEKLIQAMHELRAHAVRQESDLEPELERLHPTHAAGGRNLAHYLAVRQHDLRELQPALAALGLSSLGRMERCVLATLNAVEHALHCLMGDPGRGDFPRAPCDIASGTAALGENAFKLLGPAPKARSARVMVTLPLDSTAALIDELVSAGTDVMRINCSKGDREDWQRLVERTRAAERRQGRTCRVLCDLAGPNPRTHALGAHDLRRGAIARLSPGDRFLLAKDKSASDRALNGKVLPVVGCTLPSVLDDLRPGDRVYYDDGKISGTVRALHAGAAEIDVIATTKPRAKLRDDKGLNFPDSKLGLPSLTEKDLEDLKFVTEHADLVGLSFVRQSEDVERLREELRRANAEQLGIVLKIETLDAFTELPRLLLTAMQSERVGVMVARGDMAVELGYARLAEAQEEILWMCEAALVPVIWATQVLESLNQTGTPSRAEVTDAAMGGRAECVMLNQGEHVTEAVRFLSGLLDRMHEHQEKKRALLRRLSISELG